MFTFQDWLTVIAMGGVGLGIAAVVWPLLRIAALADARAARAEDDLGRDGFERSVDRFGYVQDARNRGDL